LLLSLQHVDCDQLKCQLNKPYKNKYTLFTAMCSKAKKQVFIKPDSTNIKRNYKITATTLCGCCNILAR